MDRNNPKVRVGDIVYYYHNIDVDNPCAAMIINVWNNSGQIVDLVVYERGSAGGRTTHRNSIHFKHCDAVKNSNVIGRQHGVWDFRDPVLFDELTPKDRAAKEQAQPVSANQNQAPKGFSQAAQQKQATNKPV